MDHNLHRVNHGGRWKLPVTEMLAAAATLRHPNGRFWDSNSDFECEDLGIAVDRPVEP
jgi:hypothetical protein